MQSWMIIGGVTFLVALGSLLFRPRHDLGWAKRLDRPHWLATVEPAIPFIWTAIFSCGAISAVLIWQQAPGSSKTWFLMGLYLLLEVITVAYIPVTLRTRSLAIGTGIGALGFVLGLVLAGVVLPISSLAALLLVPYLVWSPIGTYATRELIDFNPESI
jgi:tryptophan-rich sensory protein